MNAALKSIACFLAMLLVAGFLAQGTGQQTKEVSESVAKMRRLIRELDEAKTEEESWLAAWRVVRFIESDQFDAAAAKALLEASLECVETIAKFADMPPPAWVESRGTIFGLLRHYKVFAWGKFVKLIVPLLESEGNDDLANFAARTAAEYYASGDTYILNEWIYGYLNTGKAPPRQFLDLAFSRNAEQVYANLLHGFVRIVDGESQVIQRVRGSSKEVDRVAPLTEDAIKRTLELDYMLSYTVYPEVRKEIVALLEAEKQRARQLILRLWPIYTHVSGRRYLLEYVCRKPHLFLTPELMAMIRKEKHEVIRPLVEKLEKDYARLFPGKP